jgi:hypothetical protein
VVKKSPIFWNTTPRSQVKVNLQGGSRQHADEQFFIFILIFKDAGIAQSV